LGGVEEELRVATDRLNGLEGERKKQLEHENADKASNNEINSLAHSNLDNAIESAQREVNQVKEEIKKVNVLKEESILYAQVDGVVLALGYPEGGTTTVDMPVVGIGESDKVLAEIVISQNDITKIEENQNVYLEVSAFQDEKFMGFVKSINLKPEAQGNTTNYKVTVEVDKKDFKLLDGMTVSAQFILKDVQDVLMLSNKAITLKDGKQVVNVKNEDGTVTETEITTGFSDGKNSEIISGLSEGDTVVVGG
ncbi:MAG: efflux RND transporter periplasmic adaptor subunit, partial [Turicibacter sp.]